MIIFVRNLVAKDLWLKLFSLALGILIWVIVQGSISKDVPLLSALLGRASDENIFTVPVSAPAGDVRTISITPAEVQVTIRGEPKLLKNITADDVRAQVNLSGVESANGLRKRIEVILPAGVAYTRLSPEEVEVRVSPRN
jgi:hypothetical protein